MLVSNNDSFVKMKNPYTFGVPVRGDNFFGRKAELQEILDTLENVPRGQKQDMAILGPRRIGKSSLLYRLVDLLTPHHEFVPVYVDLQNIKPRKIHTLFYKILTEIRAGYKQNYAQVDLPPFKSLESTTIAPDLEFFIFDEDLTTLNDFIANEELGRVKKLFPRFLSKISLKAEKLFSNSHLPRLVLMFDEVELLEEFGGQDMLAWFRSLIQSMPYIIFVVAGSERLYSLTQDYGSPFFNIFKIIELHPLTSQEAKNAKGKKSHTL
ncbi:MAG: AAA family ATPase [Ardenticatenaceae bacterium]